MFLCVCCWAAATSHAPLCTMGLCAEAMAKAKRHDSNMRLTDLGREQARTVGKWLREVGQSVPLLGHCHVGKPILSCIYCSAAHATQNGPRFDSFYVSEYIRTKETAGEMDLDGAVWQPDIMVRERDQVSLDSCRRRDSYLSAACDHRVVGMSRVCRTEVAM